MARYVDDRGAEHSRSFDHKREAQRWLDGQVTALGTGQHVAPRDARVTVAEWCETWLTGYAVNRKTTVAQAKTHVRKHIVPAFGDRPLTAVRPSEVRAWVARLAADGLEPSYVYALHSRLSQIFANTCHDGLLGRSPCSRRTSPPMGKPKPYCATTAQVWAVHDALPEELRPAVLLGAFCGLRVAEACALKVDDVDWLRANDHACTAVAGPPAQDGRVGGDGAGATGAGGPAGRIGVPVRRTVGGAAGAGQQSER